MTKVLVLDIGASSGRAILCSYKDGMVFNSLEIHRFENAPINEEGSIFWDIEEIYKEVSKAMEKAHKYGYNAVSVDACGTDFALVDSEGRFVRRPLCYKYSVTPGVPERVHKIVPEDELYKRSGIKSRDTNTIFQLFSIKESDPTVLGRAKKLLMISDLICHYLTGEIKTEFTEATTTGLVNAETKNWDYDLISRLKLPKSIFCEIIKPGEVYGYLKADFTSSSKVPVIAAASYDIASALLAVPTQDSDFAFLSCGTWALFGTERDSVCNDEAAMECGISNEGGFGGKTMFLKNTMGTWLIQECQRYYQTKGEMFTYIDMEAFARSGKKFTAHIDPNAKDFFTAGEMPEKIAAYLKRTEQPVPKTISTMLRVIYESLALEFSRLLTGLEKLTGKHYPIIYIFGGGSKDKLLCELTSNATGRQVLAGPAEATSVGNAMCALVSLGAIKDISTARRTITENRMIKEINPSEKEHELWQKWEAQLSQQNI